MRNKVLWRLTPSPSEELYIRDAAKREGRPLAGIIHKLISEAILARQMAASQVSEVSQLVATIRGKSSDFTPTS